LLGLIEDPTDKFNVSNGFADIQFFWRHSLP
jgi:hypothetical protein